MFKLLGTKQVFGGVIVHFRAMTWTLIIGPPRSSPDSNYQAHPGSTCLRAPWGLPIEAPSACWLPTLTLQICHGPLSLLELQLPFRNL